MSETLMTNLTEQKIESEIREGGMETADDSNLHNLIAFGKTEDEIIKAFCEDLDSKPTFNTMLTLNPFTQNLCENIIYAWENALECNITDNHEAHEANAVPGQYDNSIIPF